MFNKGVFFWTKLKFENWILLYFILCQVISIDTEWGIYNRNQWWKLGGQTVHWPDENVKLINNTKAMCYYKKIWKSNQFSFKNQICQFGRLSIFIVEKHKGKAENIAICDFLILVTRTTQWWTNCTHTIFHENKTLKIIFVFQFTKQKLKSWIQFSFFWFVPANAVLFVF